MNNENRIKIIAQDKNYKKSHNINNQIKIDCSNNNNHNIYNNNSRIYSNYDNNDFYNNDNIYNNNNNNNNEQYNEDDEESYDPNRDIDNLIRNEYNRNNNNFSTNTSSIYNINYFNNFYSQKNNRNEEIEQKKAIEQKVDIELKEDIDLDQNEDTELEKERELKEEKKNYLNKIKKEFKFFKNKCQTQYFKSKSKINMSYNDINDYQINNTAINNYKKDLNEQLNKYETSLKNKMKGELKKYKNNLIEEFNDSSYENNDTLNNLELNKKCLESKVRIQQKKNDIQKNVIEKMKLEDKDRRIYEIKNNLNVKKSTIESRYNNKENKLKQKYENDINNYINDKIRRSQEQLYYSSNIINKNYNFQMDDVLTEYEKELNELNELKKKNLEKEIKQKMEKELEEFKAEKMNEIERNRNKIEISKLKIEQDYIVNKGIKSFSIDIQKNHIDELIKLIEKNISSYPKVINNNFIKDADNELRKMKILFHNTLNDILNGLYDEEINIKNILEEKKSKIYLLNEEILNTQYYIEYFSKIISNINKIFNQKNNLFNSVCFNDITVSDKDDFLIDEIKLIVNNIINEFNIKKENYFINSKSNEFFNNLENEFNKRNEVVINNEEEEQSINNQFFQAMNFNNNNNLFSNEAYATNFTSRNRLSSARKDRNVNMNFYQTEYKKEEIIKNKDFFNKNGNQNLFNSINDDSNFTQISDFSIKYSGPRLPNQIVNNFSKELFDIYNYILNFIMIEYSNLKSVTKNFNNKKESNKILRDLKNGIGRSYKELNAIYYQEKEKYFENKNELELQLKAFNAIKSYCEEVFNNICLYDRYKSHQIIEEQFIKIKLYIKDYYKKEYNKKIYMNNNNNNNNYDFSSKYINTFQNGLNTAKNMRYNKTFIFGARGTSYDKRDFNQKKYQNYRYDI